MSEQRESTIALLARVVDRAQERYHQIGMTNTHGLDPVARQKLVDTYEEARDEFYAAQDMLRQAMRPESA